MTSPSSQPDRAVRGYVRCLARISWWNIYFILTVIFIAVLLATDQGKELINILREQRAFSATIHSLALPSAVCALLLALGSNLVARTGQSQLRLLHEMYGTSLSSLTTLSRIVFPLCIAAAPALLIAYRYDEAEVWLMSLLLIALIIATLGIVEFARNKFDRTTGRIARLATASIFFLMLCVMFVAMAQGAINLLSVDYARRVGTIGIVLTAISGWAAIFTLLFVALPVRIGLPSMAVLPPLIWLIVAAFYDPNTFPHRRSRDVPVTNPVFNYTEPSWTPRASFEDSLALWLKQFSNDDSNAPIPLYVVSAEGGGIRAAFWTARVLAGLNSSTNGRFAKHTFAYSGVSGGSLGVALFVDAAVRRQVDAYQIVGHIDRFFANDFLAPLVARLLITEPFWQLFGEHIYLLPRDVAFEQLLADDWKKISASDSLHRHFLEIFAIPTGTQEENDSRSFFPVVMLNTTIVEQGRRAIVSNAALPPTAANESHAYDLLNPRSEVAIADMTLAEAIHLSARFPYLSPPAALEVRTLITTRAYQSDLPFWGHVVDGGYFDNSGTDVLAEVVKEITRRRNDALARIQTGASTNDPKSAVDTLLRRLQVITIVIRNDPHERDNQALSFPLLQHADPDDILAGLAFSGFKPDALAHLLPKNTPLSELTAPVETFFATRDARAAVSRLGIKTVTLNAHTERTELCASQIEKLISQRRKPQALIRSDSENQAVIPQSVFVDLHIPEKQRQRYSNELYSDLFDADKHRFLVWLCGDTSDRYVELSLANQYVISKTTPKELGWLPSNCVPAKFRRSIALGWVLSDAVRQNLICLASTVHPPQLVGNPLAFGYTRRSSKKR